jgi:lipopolysaccharide transport system ATP-binding protein
LSPAISVRHLSKRYRIGERARLDGSFREMLVNVVKTAARRAHASSPVSRGEAFLALDDVSFDVEPGEVMAVIGRNGAGKSTLLKVLSRITPPTSGRAELRGRVASLLEVGTGFHPELTGRENVFLNGAILGMRRAEIRRKFDAIVEFAEVARFIDTPVKHFSSGMYLRLAFAVAAHLDGEILLVDEVLAVGDAAFQKKCLGKMRDVSRGGRTVLFVSHNMTAVSALCTRAIVMSGGRAAFDGPAREGIRQYLGMHQAAAASDWVVGRLPRASEELGTLVRLDRVAVGSARSDGFRFGECLRFRLDVSAFVTAEIQCAIGLDDIFGSRVVTFSSDQEPITAAPGARYELEVTVPAFGLRPGSYLLSASLYSGARYHDYLVHFGAMCVVPLDEDEEQHVDDQMDRGPIAAASRWCVRELRPVAAL